MPEALRRGSARARERVDVPLMQAVSKRQRTEALLQETLEKHCGHFAAQLASEREAEQKLLQEHVPGHPFETLPPPPQQQLQFNGGRPPLAHAQGHCRSDRLQLIGSCSCSVRSGLLSASWNPGRSAMPCS